MNVKTRLAMVLVVGVASLAGVEGSSAVPAEESR